MNSLPSITNPIAPCGAKTRSGHACKRPGVGAGGRCKYHGGRSTGPKTLKAAGKYSKDLPTRLAARFEEIVSDEELVALRDELRVLDAFAAEELSKLDDADSSEAWKEALEKAVYIRVEMNEGKTPRKALDSLIEILQHGVGQVAVIDRWRGMASQRMQLAAQEHARMQKLEAQVSDRQLVIFTAQIVAILNEIITDPNVRIAAAKRLAALCA